MTVADKISGKSCWTGVPEKLAAERAKFAYGIVETPRRITAYRADCVRLGRKRAFALLHGRAAHCAGHVLSAENLRAVARAAAGVRVSTLSVHAGYDYFPELFRLICGRPA